ncbi:MAG: hypothetical protein U5O39_15940 [Gammaproteobacteria bacterium]|nr:hypothetical protein [Gammaproteobacteria bacterium]
MRVVEQRAGEDSITTGFCTGAVGPHTEIDDNVSFDLFHDCGEVLISDPASECRVIQITPGRLGFASHSAYVPPKSTNRKLK